MDKLIIIIKPLIFIILMQITLFSNNIQTDLDKQKTQEILYRESIDLDAKSLKGWIRVINSKTKTKTHAIHLTLKEKKTILLYLQDLYELKRKKYSKVVK